MSELIQEQSAPIPNDNPDVWLLVIDEMQERRLHGIEKYGVPVQVGSGRSHLIDLYQELLDACVYARQEIERQNIVQQETSAALQAVEEWLNDASTWKNSLDDYSDVGLAEMVLRRVRCELGKRNLLGKPTK